MLGVRFQGIWDTQIQCYTELKWPGFYPWSYNVWTWIYYFTKRSMYPPKRGGLILYRKSVWKSLFSCKGCTHILIIKISKVHVQIHYRELFHTKGHGHTLPAMKAFCFNCVQWFRVSVWYDEEVRKHFPSMLRALCSISSTARKKVLIICQLYSNKVDNLK